ncbi:MAG: hypothetical protein METHAR1v1_1330007 [Methanothrix sp.]|nr:MAG: hypothetical protein METHAR1v1_1330007 [Methanothrix sp.]
MSHTHPEFLVSFSFLSYLQPLERNNMIQGYIRASIGPMLMGIDSLVMIRPP